MIDRIYISSRYPREHVVWITSKLARAGFAPSGVCVWDSVGAFVATLKQGDRVVVHSLGVFNGSVELFGALRLIFERGATVYSVREPDLADRLTLSLVEALFLAAVEGLLGHRAADFIEVDPSVVERLFRMDRLIRQNGLSVSEASRQSGCSRNIYYYYKRKDRKAGVDLQPCKAEVRTDVMRTNFSIWPQLSL